MQQFGEYNNTHKESVCKISS